MVWLTLLAGLVILTAGAECLVRGSSRLAAAAGVTPLVIGLTVVAYGTSTPELAVSIKSAWAGQSDIALGNAVGSNIFNVLLILGACALILPLKVNVQLVRFDVPILIATAVLTLVLGYDGTIGRIDGVLLLAAIVVYTAFIVWKSRSENKADTAEFEVEYGGQKNGGSTLVNVLIVLAGLVFLVLGARMFVNASIAIAQALGVSELVIGLTIVAAGTSLPEVATSIVATIRGERDIAIGNVVGSNIYNVLAVLGTSSLLKPITVSPQAIAFDIPVMIAVSIACLPIFFTGLAISRWEGAMFLAYYAAYTAFLIMHSRAGGVPPAFAAAMTYFVLPLTAVTLGVLTWREFRMLRTRTS